MEKERNKARIRLQAFDGKQSLGSFTTEHGKTNITIGSAHTADFTLPGTKISALHAMVRLTDEENFVLYDLGSQYGVRVADQKTLQTKIQRKTRFHIANQEFEIDLLPDNAGKDFAPEANLFWKNRCNSNESLDIAHLENGQLSKLFQLRKSNALYSGFEEKQINLQGLEANTRFIKRSRKKGKQVAICVIPAGYTAEIYNANNQLINTYKKAGTVFEIQGNEKVRLHNGVSETQIYWRGTEDRLDRNTPDPENDRLRKSMLGSCVLSIAFMLLMHIQSIKQTEELDMEKKRSSYFRVSTKSPAPAPAFEAPAPTPTTPEVAAPVMPKKKVVVTKQKKKAPLIRNLAGNRRSKVKSIGKGGSKQQGVATTAPVKQKPKPQLNAMLKNTLGKLVNRNGSAKFAKSSSNVGRKIAKAGGGTQLSTGSSNLKSSFNGNKVGNLSTAALSNALAKGKSNAGSLKGFKGATGTSLGALFGKDGPDMNVSIGGTEMELSGGLDKDTIARIVRENLGQIKHCYERQLVADPDLYGKVVAKWVITGDGRVSKSSIKKSTMNNANIEKCISSKILAWKFPKPKGGGKVLVSYPFLFKSVH